MGISLKMTLNGLSEAMQNGAGPAPGAKELVEALAMGRYVFERETWHKLENCEHHKKDRVPGEMLIRAYRPDGTIISPEAPIKSLYSQPGNARYLFDSFIFLAALDQTVKTGSTPVSVNVSSKNVRSESFWRGVSLFFDHFFSRHLTPHDVIFELLEDDDGHDADLASLAFMRDKGFRFALDDLENTPYGHARLRNLGPHVDFVKIDGKTVTAADRDAAGKANYDDLIARIETAAPQASIVAEHVASAAAASTLRAAYHKTQPFYVQGRTLNDNTFPADYQSTRPPALRIA